MRDPGRQARFCACLGCGRRGVMPLLLSPLTLRGRDVVLSPLETSHIDALAGAAAESRERYGFSWIPDGVDGAAAYVERALIARDRGERVPFVIAFDGRIV